MTIKPCAWWWMWYWSHEPYSRKEFDSGATVIWTCNEKTRAGDYAVLYVKQPTSAIVGLLQATSDAEPDRDALEHTIHPHACEAEVICFFAAPAKISDLRRDRWLLKNWGLLRANFQASHGKAPRFNDDILLRLARHIDELKRYVAIEE